MWRFFLSLQNYYFWSFMLYKIPENRLISLISSQFFIPLSSLFFFSLLKLFSVPCGKHCVLYMPLSTICFPGQWMINSYKTVLISFLRQRKQKNLTRTPQAFWSILKCLLFSWNDPFDYTYIKLQIFQASEGTVMFFSSPRRSW